MCGHWATGQDGGVEPDAIAMLGLGIGLVALLGTALARRTGVPDPVVLVAAGLAASLLPSAPAVELPPDLVFLLFLPALLYRASFLTDPKTLRDNATPLALLSVGLVLLTAGAVAVVASLVVPGVGLAEGLVLGAIVAPTDPVAATGVFSRLGAPRRVIDIVEGESLVNDATALVLYAVAVEAVVSGPPSPGAALGRLVLSVVGGIAVGVVVGLVVLAVRARLADVGLQLLLSLLTPYLAYLPADRLGASGVLAVVTTGVLLGSRSGGRFGAATRLQTGAFWLLLDLVLNAVLFVLLGLEVRQVLDDAPDLAPLALTGSVLVVVGTVVTVRLVWQFVVPPPVYRLKAALGRAPSRSSPRERLVIGWTGMRGAISLAAALALPLQTRTGVFPARGLLVFLTVSVVLATLAVQGTTLPLLLRAMRLTSDEADDELGRRTRLALADVALARLDELEATGEVPPGAASPFAPSVGAGPRPDHRRRRARPGAGVDLARLRLDLAQVQGTELERRRRAGELPPEVARSLRRELDLQQVRLTGTGSDQPAGPAPEA